MQLELGTSETLTITSDIGDQTVSWTSTDPSVATTDENGTVAAIEFGTAKIIATVGDMAATCEVEVALGELKFEQTELSLNIEETNVLFITTKIGNAEVVWESSDPSVAAVSDKGEVTAVGFGKAEITAAVADQKATSVIVVTLSELNFDQTNLSLVEGSKKDLTISTNIGDAPVVWQSSNSEIAEVKDGIVYAIKSGTVTISATVESITAECVVTVRKPIKLPPFEPIIPRPVISL